jgi:aspartokinase
MLEMASLGAEGLADTFSGACPEYNVPILVKSSLVEGRGHCM